MLVLAQEGLLPQQEHLSLLLHFAFVGERDEEIANIDLRFDGHLFAAIDRVLALGLGIFKLVHVLNLLDIVFDDEVLGPLEHFCVLRFLRMHYFGVGVRLLAVIVDLRELVGHLVGISYCSQN